jgi:uncharacterized protein (TIGR03382 family)
VRRAIASLALSTALLSASGARAYQIGSSVSTSCHEQITLEAIAQGEQITLAAPEDPEAGWYRHGDRLSRVVLGREATSASERLVIASAVLGVRRPDLGENGLIHITDIRYIHLLDEHQVRHFLRQTTQDGEAGAVQAAEDGRAFIIALIDASADAYDADPTGERLEPVRVWLEDYGHIDIHVWLPLFFLAQALHVVQDSFTHTYRTADTRRIVAIQNYSDADGDHDEMRDGPRHSDALDDCTREDTMPLVMSATDASAELVRATQQYWIDRDRAAVEAVLDDWMTYEPGCSLANDYCGSPWVPIAKTAETSALLGCSAAPGSRAPAASIVFALIAGAVLVRRRR